MNILISGATGLVGSALRPYLEQQGHQVYILHRNRKSGSFYWQPNQGQIHLDENIHLDAVINLNGVNIGDKPWNAARKQALIESRVQSTQLLSEAISKRFDPPSVLINASAIGYYGDTANQAVDETSPPGSNFLTEIVGQWEAAAKPAQDAKIRTVFIRSGVIITPNGGALKKMLLPFKLGLGGKVGNGQQYMSWISLTDEIRAIDFLLHSNINGPVNLTAPNPVTNIQFTAALGKVLNRPTIFPMPEFMVKTLFGEMGNLLLLGSNRVLPKVLEANGFKFHHNQVTDALDFELKRR